MNRALHKLPFKMLTERCMIKASPGTQLVCSDRPEGHLLSRFDPSAIVSTVCVRRSGMAVQGPPHQLSLSPRVFTKVVEGALTPLREVGVRILNYLDDWLILAQSREQLGDHRDLVLRHLSQLGLRVNWEKSKLSPVQRISFSCGVRLGEYDGTHHGGTRLFGRHLQSCGLGDTEHLLKILQSLR